MREGLWVTVMEVGEGGGTLFSPVMPVHVPWKASFPFVRGSGVECKWRPPPACMYSEWLMDLLSQRGLPLNELTLKRYYDRKGGQSCGYATLETLSRAGQHEGRETGEIC